jgi:hypothetical protein
VTTWASRKKKPTFDEPIALINDVNSVEESIVHMADMAEGAEVDSCERQIKYISGHLDAMNDERPDGFTHPFSRR